MASIRIILETFSIMNVSENLLNMALVGHVY
jgi:hypothetical protein